MSINHEKIMDIILFFYFYIKQYIKKCPHFICNPYTGTGKTRLATGLMYRLIKSQRFKHILFLVDRSTLGTQAFDAFGAEVIEQGQTLAQIYNALLSLADGIEQTVQSAQKRVNLLTQSILAKAFSGELTAEWREQHQELITGINSAESLLAKIQAEREASKPVKKAKKVK